MKMQDYLQYLTELEINRAKSAKIRGVIAIWKEEIRTVSLSFYFDGEISDNDIDVASDISVYVIAHFSDGLLEESYVHLDYPKPLPESIFLAYKRKE